MRGFRAGKGGLALLASGEQVFHRPCCVFWGKVCIRHKSVCPSLEYASQHSSRSAWERPPLPPVGPHLLPVGPPCYPQNSFSQLSQMQRGCKGGSATGAPSAESTGSPAKRGQEFPYGECLLPNPGLPKTSLQGEVTCKVLPVET